MLRIYYTFRAAFSILWVALAFTIAAHAPAIAAALLLIYPDWDGLANDLDASRSGGLSKNRTQAINVVVSIITTIAVAIALGRGMNAFLAVFGAWALLAGVPQLATVVHRWKRYGAQWVMVRAARSRPWLASSSSSAPVAPISALLRTSRAMPGSAPSISWFRQSSSPSPWPVAVPSPASEYRL